MCNRVDTVYENITLKWKMAQMWRTVCIFYE